ncbi:MAG TPA: DUF4349 domain-containing protein [Blastocatellia bacterium]|nr:DUF4349 domain-containing protein [Blastocatellia bacterium]
MQGRIEAYSRGGGGGGNDQQIVQDADRATISTISTVRASTQAADRKIIRNADLTIETNSPTDGLRRVTSIAESNGGFVVTSDFKHIDSAPQARPTQTVTVVARVPSSRFDAALSQIHDIDGHVIGEKISGQDVSEEYLDLEARLRTKRALEAQFLEIMRQARKVSDALEVQSELADVRTDIERLEGRRRFIENQAELSTITATLQMPQPIVVATTTGFSHSVKQSFGDAVDVASWIVLTVIQTIIVLIPVAVLIGLPGWVAFRILRRRFQSTKQAAVVPQA